MGVGSLLITKNPAALVVNAGLHAYQQFNDINEVEERAVATTNQIADVLQQRFKELNWIK